MDLKTKQLEEYFLLLKEDKNILEDIYDVTYRAIFAFIFSITKHKESALDITHDTYITLYQNIHSYKAKGHPMAYLYTIAKNCTNMYFRKHKYECLCEEHLQIPSINMDPNSRITIEYLLNVLTEEEREIVVMRIFSDLPFKDIAKILKIPISTALSKYHRSIKKMKENAMEVKV